MRILIIKPSSMGDVLHAFPAVHALMKQTPAPEIDWVIHPAFAELLDYLPGVRRKIFFRRKELGRFSTFFPAFRELFRELRRERYDAVVDLQGLMRSALIGRLARCGKVYGPASARELPARLCYSRQLKVPPQIHHAVEKNCAMIEDFSGLTGISPEYRLPVVEEYRVRAEKLLSAHGISPEMKLIAIAPGARWQTKEWPPEFFSDVLKRTAEKLPQVHFILLGSKAEKTLCSRIQSAAPEFPSVDLSGETTPGELVELIRRSEVLLCNDSGPMHIAAAAGTPVSALFGPTDPELTGPYARNSRVLRPELDCVCCFRKQCETEECHKRIVPQKMAETVFELLKQGAGK